MKEAILFLALICMPVVFAYPTSVEQYPQKCGDPTYACQDLETARFCGVVKSCINDIWSTMNAPDNNEDVCTICKEMVKEARDQLLSNMTQEEIKEVFEGSCKLIPVKLISGACIKIVDEFIPELVEMLASRMDPNMVCTVSGLCDLAYLPVEKDDGNVKDDLTCQFCTRVLEHVKDLITANTTVEEFRTALQNFCKHTGKFSTKCADLVNNYFDEIFAFIKNLDTKGFCTLAGLCDKGNSGKLIPLIKLVPAAKIHKKVPMAKLIPAHSASIMEVSSFKIKIEPSAMPSKRQSNDIDSNSIFASLPNQLPVERFDHPSFILNNDMECALCKAISFYVQQDLGTERSEKAIEASLLNMCSKWMKELPDYCEKMMKRYSSQMKFRIYNGANFEDLCILMKACPVSANPDIVKKTVHPESFSSIFCDACKVVFNEIEQLLEEPNTKRSVEKLLGQICVNLPSSLRDECNKFIDDNLDQLFNILEQELVADNVCPALRLCPSLTYVKKPAKKIIRNIECDLCKDFVQQLQAKLQEPDVKVALKNLLDKGCAALPEEIATQCKDFVNQNVDNLINILVQDMDPSMVCSALSLCQNKIIRPVTNEIECDFCKEIIQEVDEKLKDQRTEEKIKEALSEVCSYLPQSYADKCKNFVDTYSALLISLLAQEMDPKVVCIALKLCPDSGHVLMKQRVKTIECDLCKEIVQKLDDELKDKTTEEEIKEALEKVCSYFPSSISDKCSQFIDSYADIVIELLAEELTPSMVCGALKICAGKADIFKEWQKKAKNLECEGCQYFLHYVQNMLMDSKVQGEIKGFVVKVCNIMPEQFANNCHAFIDEFGSSLLAIIAHDIDPTILCSELFACPKNSSVIYRDHSSLDKLMKTDECSMCKAVVDYFDTLLEQDDIDKEITALVEKVCSVIPSSLKEKCSTMIEVYGPYILQMIGQSLDSTEVCQAVDLCTHTPGHVHLLGGEKCTFGPSYWCQSKYHASACKAEMYCKQRNWQT